MLPSSPVLADIAALRNLMRGTWRHTRKETDLMSPAPMACSYAALYRLRPARVLGDIAWDLFWVFLATLLVFQLGGSAVLPALVLIGNRQRALGNILHDAGHRNLWRSHRHNDGLAHALVAPLMFASLSRYRATHFKHHMQLGNQAADPDFIALPKERPNRWWVSYFNEVFKASTWLGSLAGHLFSAPVGWRSKLYIAIWWFGLLTILAGVAGPAFAGVFLALWLLARATTFHLITTFREMCDHVGLEPGGVLSYTRDMPCHGFWRWLIHPRNNGYHLTHHLLPAVPYYRLPEAHELLNRQPMFRERAQVANAYFGGAGAVVRSWQSGLPV